MATASSTDDANLWPRWTSAYVRRLGAGRSGAAVGPVVGLKLG